MFGGRDYAKVVRIRWMAQCQLEVLATISALPFHPGAAINFSLYQSTVVQIYMVESMEYICMHVPNMSDGEDIHIVLVQKNLVTSIP